MDVAREVVNAQLALAWRRAPAVSLLDRLLNAVEPTQVLAAVEAARAPSLASVYEPGGPHPAALRARFSTELGLTSAELAFRSLYPGLDVGIYAASHSMGIPSVAGPAAVIDQLGQLSRSGIRVWDDGVWVEVMDRYRAVCAELVGGSLSRGDVAWFPNVSEALSAVLECVRGGALVYTEGHFTTGHYVHHAWAARSGGRLIEVPVDPDGAVATARLLDAVTPDTRVVSISHALFESGWLQDLSAIAAGVRERAPDALLLVDAYQTAGTVPIDADALGDHVLVTAGGHKQLRSGTGASFLYAPRRVLCSLDPARTGWWNHADPFAFEKGPVRRALDATRFRTGTPTLTGMAMLLGELAALASSTNGVLHDAVGRARRVTAGLVQRGLERAVERGLDVRGSWGAEHRAAYLTIRHPRARHVTEALAADGIQIDYRPLTQGSQAGILRVSGNAAGFGYEMDAVIDAIALVP